MRACQWQLVCFWLTVSPVPGPEDAENGMGQQSSHRPGMMVSVLQS